MKIIKCIISILLLFQCTLALWASGKLEEKYYFILNQNEFPAHNRNLEHAIFEYAYHSKIKMSLLTLDNTSTKDKTTILKEGIEDKYPVLIFQNYNPTLLTSLIEDYYKKGTFRSSGLMGSFIVLDAIPNPPPSLTIPWIGIEIDIETMTAHILESLSLIPHDNKDANTKNQVILLYIDTTIENEINMSKELLTALTHAKHTYNLSHLEIVPLLSSSEITTKQDTQETSLVQQHIQQYIDIHQGTLNTIRALIILNDTLALEGYQVFDTFQNPPALIGFGGSPEALQAIEDGTMTLTFTMDYDYYVEKIMESAHTLMEQVASYTVTDEMIDDNSLYKSFTPQVHTIPVQPVP